MLSRISSKYSTIPLHRCRITFLYWNIRKLRFITEIFLCKCFRLNNGFSRVQSLKQHSLNENFHFIDVKGKFHYLSDTWSFLKKQGKRLCFITTFFLETKLFLIEELISALHYILVDLELLLILVKNFSVDLVLRVLQRIKLLISSSYVLATSSFFIQLY